MPARQSKTAKSGKKSAAATSKPQNTKKRRQKSTASKSGQAGKRSTAVNPSWKTTPRTTNNYVLNTYDWGIKLLMHRVPANIYDEIHSTLIDARNRVAAALESLRVPPSKQDYNHLSTTLASQKEAKEQLEQRLSCFNSTLDAQERELQKMEKDKIHLQDFGKLPGKCHPLLQEPLEEELYLNLNTMK